uniref:Uncharacterized protein n=1 Tax=Heliothis virescens TaxID=7102 RepID=A0A2A4K0J2_HELVI
MDTMTTDTMDDSNDGPSTSFVTNQPELNIAENKRFPIVYTTKLDDMLIFKTKLPDMRMYDIVDCIITESHPKYQGKLKRKYSERQDLSFENLTQKIDKINRKVARTATRNKTLLSMCKPFNIFLKDCNDAIRTDALTRVERKNIEIPIRKTVPICVDKLLPMYSKSQTFKCRLIYDNQLKVADIYSLDDNYFTNEYIRIHNIQQYDEDYRRLKTSKNIYEVICCCWYNREAFIKKLALHPPETIRFMRKPHGCPINDCSCCCKNKTSFPKKRYVGFSLQKTEMAPSVWFAQIKSTLASKPMNDVQGPKLITKSLAFDPGLSQQSQRSNHYEKQNNSKKIVHSINIYIGEEYYEIGKDGQVRTHLKNFSEEASKLKQFTGKELKYTSSNVCCWYKREELAVQLLKLGVLLNTVNFIRCVHPCPIRKCNCCCKPSFGRTVDLISTRITTRHTNDLANKEVGIQLQFPIAKRHIQRDRTTIEDRNIVAPMLRCVVPVRVDRQAFKAPKPDLSFLVSLAVLDTVSNTKIAAEYNSLFPPGDNINDSQNTSLPTVRVKMIKIGTVMNRYKTIIEGVDLNNASTKELQLLDLIFRAIDRNLYTIKNWRKKQAQKLSQEVPATRQVLPSQQVPPTRQVLPSQELPPTQQLKGKAGSKPRRKVIQNTEYPQLLNEELRIAADLKSKRFIPSLQAFLGPGNIPHMHINIQDYYYFW